ncbi:MAG: hypothetical protein L0206_09855, partial [Actinobacteria bacterium]|nr:hypothetical protein [Actinomycetota bacterium]
MRTLLLLALSAPVCAHDVHVVGSTPPDFPDIQAAVNAAVDGDAVVVHPGTYPGFTLAGKGVSIVGLEENGARPRIDGDVAVQGLTAAQSAVVRGFDLDYGLIALTGNAGAVLLEDVGGYGAELDVTSSFDVVLVRTFFYTVDAQASSLHAYEADISGASDGKTALKVVDGFAFLSGSRVIGGTGAPGASGSIFWPLCSDGGTGGIGMYLQNSQVYRLDTLILGGGGGPPGVGKLGPPCSWGPSGPAVVGSGLVDVPGTARDFEISSPGVEDEKVHLRAEGAAGELVFVLVGSSLDPLWFPPWSGTVAVPFTSLLLSLGVVPPWGEIEADVLVGELGPGLEGVELFAQGAFVSVPGPVVVEIGPPSAVELVDRNAILIDCNGNGVQDKTDIATGTSSDCNGDGQPDECDIAAGESADCNGNGVPDECDIA